MTLNLQTDNKYTSATYKLIWYLSIDKMEKLTKEFSFDPPPVKKKKVDAKGCLIHCRDIDAEVTQFTSKSWEKVWECGQL